MAFVSEIFDQVRDLLNDSGDTQVTFAQKKLYVNNGIRRMWPHCYRVVTDLTVVLVANTFEYNLPADLANGDLLSVFVETDIASGQYVRLSYFEIYELSNTNKVIWFPNNTLPSPAGSRVRLNWAEPISLVAAATYVAAQAETWNGREDQIQLPAYYAAALIAARKIDDRQDTSRYSTTQAFNGVTDSDLMEASQMWMGQFELELAQQGRPFPPAVD